MDASVVVIVGASVASVVVAASVVVGASLVVIGTSVVANNKQLSS